MGLFSDLTKGGPLDTVLRVGTLGLSDKAGLTGDVAQASPLAYSADQAELIAKLKARANGEGPSLAEAQTNQNMGKVLANQVSAVRSGPGLNPALQARLAGQAGQQAATDAAQQGTIARLAERDAAEQALGNQILGAQGSSLSQDKLNMDSTNSNANRWTNLISGAGTAAVAASDKNAKENIKDSNGDARSLIDHLKGKLYEYKDDSNGPGVHVGIMAQDLEKSPLGRSMVFEDNGTKKVDFGKGFGAVLAAVAEINDKLKELDGKGKK
jgi:hypothetical protein